MHDRSRADRILGELAARCATEPALAALGPLIAAGPVRDLIAGIFGASPFLSSLIERWPASLLAALAAPPEQHFDALCRDVAAAVDGSATAADAMRVLRRFKTEVALLAALCDLAGAWPVMTITQRLSQAADAAVASAVRFLFRQAHRKGDWLSPDPDGYVIEI